MHTQIIGRKKHFRPFRYCACH